jgi:hypothetical protein
MGLAETGAAVQTSHRTDARNDIVKAFMIRSMLASCDSEMTICAKSM